MVPFTSSGVEPLYLLMKDIWLVPSGFCVLGEAKNPLPKLFQESDCSLPLCPRDCYTILCTLGQLHPPRNSWHGSALEKVMHFHNLRVSVLKAVFLKKELGHSIFLTSQSVVQRGFPLVLTQYHTFTTPLSFSFFLPLPSVAPPFFSSPIHIHVPCIYPSCFP